MRKTRLFLATAFVAIVSLALAGVASADGSVSWTGHGSGNLPCAGGGHWVLSNAQGVTGATLHVNGDDYPMSQSGQGSWSADSGALGDSVTASVDYTGDAEGTPQLQLSHCNAPPPTETPITPTETPVPPTATNTPEEPTPTNTPEGPTSTPGGPTNTPVPPTNTPVPSPHRTPPPETPTGAGDSFPFLAIPVVAAGFGLLLFSARRRFTAR